VYKRKKKRKERGADEIYTVTVTRGSSVTLRASLHKKKVQGGGGHEKEVAGVRESGGGDLRGYGSSNKRIRRGEKGDINREQLLVGPATHTGRFTHETAEKGQKTLAGHLIAISSCVFWLCCRRGDREVGETEIANRQDDKLVRTLLEVGVEKKTDGRQGDEPPGPE